MAPGAAACLLPPASYELRTFQKLKVETTRHAIVEIGELTWNINVRFFDHLDIFFFGNRQLETCGIYVYFSHICQVCSSFRSRWRSLYRNYQGAVLCLVWKTYILDVAFSDTVPKLEIISFHSIYTE